MRIKIGIWTYEKVYSVDADDSKREIMIDGQYVEYVPEFIQQAIGIVKDWPDKLDNYPGDTSRGVVYKVTYNDGTTERTMTGNHKTPDNFRDLMQLIYNHRPRTKKEIQIEIVNKLLSNDMFKAYTKKSQQSIIKTQQVNQDFFDDDWY